MCIGTKRLLFTCWISLPQALFSSPALQREATVFGLRLQTGATWRKRALDSQLVRICDKFTFWSPNILPSSMYSIFIGSLLLQWGTGDSGKSTEICRHSFLNCKIQFLDFVKVLLYQIKWYVWKIMTHYSTHSGIPVVDSQRIIWESKTRMSCWVLLKRSGPQWCWVFSIVTLILIDISLLH